MGKVADRKQQLTPKQFSFIADTGLQKRFLAEKAKRLLQMTGSGTLTDAELHREIYNEGLKKFEQS